MKLHVFALALGLFFVVIGLVGCGGSDTGLDKFAGSWTGTHRFYPQNNANFEDSGLMNLTVFSGGLIEGTMTKSSTGETVAVTGFVTNSGSFTLSWRFNGFGSQRTVEGPVRVLNSELRPNNDESRLSTTQGAAGKLEFRLVRN